MCSRYAASADPKTLAARFGVSAAPGLKPRYNAAPGQAAAVVIASPEPRMSLLRWGLLPAWARIKSSTALSPAVYSATQGVIPGG